MCRNFPAQANSTQLAWQGELGCRRYALPGRIIHTRPVPPRHGCNARIVRFWRTHPHMAAAWRAWFVLQWPTDAAAPANGVQKRRGRRRPAHTASPRVRWCGRRFARHLEVHVHSFWRGGMARGSWVERPTPGTLWMRLRAVCCQPMHCMVNLMVCVCCVRVLNVAGTWPDRIY